MIATACASPWARGENFVELRRLGAGALQLLKEVRVRREHASKRRVEHLQRFLTAVGMRVRTGPKNATPSMWMRGRAYILGARPGSPCRWWCDLRSASSYIGRVGGVGQRLGSRPGLDERPRRSSSRSNSRPSLCQLGAERGVQVPQHGVAVTSARRRWQTRTGTPAPRSSNSQVLLRQVLATGSLSTESDMTRKDRSMSRCFSTSRIHRELTHAKGQSGSISRSPGRVGPLQAAEVVVMSSTVVRISARATSPSDQARGAASASSACVSMLTSLWIAAATLLSVPIAKVQRFTGAPRRWPSLPRLTPKISATLPSPSDSSG